MDLAGANFDRYSTILFPDANVVLEGKPLAELPWHEIDPVGPVLLLFVPQVNHEIDKRKRDGRLGPRARAFNRLISSAAETGLPSQIVAGPPAVDIAIASRRRIDWDAFDDLDPNEGDARVLAQVLHARDIPPERRVLLSHDINLISTATQYGINKKKMPDNWLMQPEPSPLERENTRLKARVRELENPLPKLTATLRFGLSGTVMLFRASPLAASEQEALVAQVIQDNPKRYQGMFPRDFSLDERYQRYVEERVPRYAATLHERLEAFCNQVPFCFELENSGNRQAENVVVTLQAKGGTLHDRFVFPSVYGPTPPKEEPFRLNITSIHDHMKALRQAGRHEIRFTIGPDRGDTIEIQCIDFRQGMVWSFDGIAALNPRSTTPFLLEAEITASNLPGSIQINEKLDFIVSYISSFDLFDYASQNIKRPIPMKAQLEQADREGRKISIQAIDDDE